VIGRSAEHQSGADTFGRLHIQEVACALGGAEAQFAGGTQIRVVADDDPSTEPVRQLKGRIETDPAGQRGGGMDAIGPDVQRGRDPGSDGADLAQAQPGLTEQSVHHAGGHVQRGGRLVVHVHHRVFFGPDLPVGGGDRDRHPVVVEVDADHNTGPAGGHQQRRRAAPTRPLAAGREHVLGDQPFVEQVLHGLRDGAAGQTGEQA
jgi:hypothetical protein